jgi:hypothetical protein
MHACIQRRVEGVKETKYLKDFFLHAGAKSSSRCCWCCCHEYDGNGGCHSLEVGIVLESECIIRTYCHSSRYDLLPISYIIRKYEPSGSLDLMLVVLMNEIGSTVSSFFIIIIMFVFIFQLFLESLTQILYTITKKNTSRNSKMASCKFVNNTYASYYSVLLIFHIILLVVNLARPHHVLFSSYLDVRNVRPKVVCLLKKTKARNTTMCVCVCVCLPVHGFFFLYAIHGIILNRTLNQRRVCTNRSINSFKRFLQKDLAPTTNDSRSGFNSFFFPMMCLLGRERLTSYQLLHSMLSKVFYLYGSFVFLYFLSILLIVSSISNNMIRSCFILYSGDFI